MLTQRVLETRPETPAGSDGRVIFLADAAAFKTLCAHPALGGPARLRWSVQRVVGYDTESADLRRSGLVLEMRRARGRVTMSLQKNDDGGAVEVTASGEAPKLELLPAPARGLVARAAARRSLRPAFASQIRRASRLFAYEGAMIEIAFSEGEFVGEGVKRGFHEIALRTKAGAPAALFRLGVALSSLAPLRIGPPAREDPLAPAAGATKAAPPDFGAEATLDAAIVALLRQSLEHFLVNWPALDGPDAPEAVHQIRVALRRLRSLLAVLKRAFPAAELDFLRAEAKRIADAFGQARDWRVFSDMVAAGPARHLPQAAGLPALIARADARAAEGQRSAGATLDESATTRFVLALQTYVAARGWRNAARPEDLPRLGEPALGFAAGALEFSFRRLNKRARGFKTLAPEARHQMRIALKQVRYAVDFFGHLFDDDVEGFARKSAELQELLGLANDAAVASQLVASLDVEGDAQLAFAAGAVAGWCERGGQVDEKALRRAWKRLREARRFWREALPEDRPVPA